MTKLTTSSDFATSRRGQQIIDFNMAFAGNDIDKIVSMMGEDAVWTMVGTGTYTGSEAILKALKEMGSDKAIELKMDAIIEQGDTCAASGQMVFEDSAVGFCDLYEFDHQHKITKLTSYGLNV